MQHTLTWNAQGYRVDGVPTPLVSGEFHYFRVPKKDWRYRLTLLKESGANTVATYIPWIVHEPEEGHIVFDDCPQRDLTAFLKLCDELDLMVIARPGPYQYSEIVRGGLPCWLADDYPEVIARRKDGSFVSHRNAVSYMHPLFLAKARRYIRAADELLRPFLRTNGGPVMMVQIDNEIAGIQVWAGSLDYNPDGMGYFREDGIYPRYLKEKYGTVAAANAAYGTAFTAFTAVDPRTDGPADDTVGGKRFVQDYYRAYITYLEAYACTVAGWFREDGINVPLCTNAASINETPLLHRIPALVSTPEQPCLMGTDHYYTLGPEWGNNPTPQRFLSWTASLDLVRAAGQPPTLFELQGGNLADFPPMLPEDLASMYAAQSALGVKGVNYYIFTGGPNFGDTGACVDVYDYHAAIGADNEIRPHYYCQKDSNTFAHTHAWMQTVDRTVGVQVGFTWEQRQMDRYSPRYAKNGLSLNDYAESVTFALTGSGYLPGYVEPENEPDPAKPLIFPCDGRMSAEKQQALIRYLEQGGRLVLTPFVPTEDEDMNPCTLLADYIGLHDIAPLENPDGKIRLADGTVIYGVGNTQTGVMEDSTVLATAFGTDTPTVLMRRIGAGTVIWMGVSFNYRMFSHNTLIEQMCAALGEAPRVESDSYTVWTTLFEDGDHAVCRILNLLGGKQQAHIAVTANGVRHDLGLIELPANTVKTVDL